MGAVYRATDSILHRDVALKVIHPDRAGDAEARARFLRECRAAAAINHPNIATIHDAGEAEDGSLYFVSELVEGETLQAALARGRIPLGDAVSLGSQLAQALAAAHARGIVHRDIKPANIAITEGGRLKVLDFGLARAAAEPTRPGGAEGSTVTGQITQERTIVGTPAYMSPEQAAGLAVDERTDVFSAGAVIYEMLSGRSAFAAPTQQETFHRVLSVDPEPLEKVDASVPADLTGIVARALSKDRAHRLSSSRELADVLLAVKDRLERGETQAAAPGGAPRGARIRRRVLVAGAGLAVAAVAVLGLLLFTRSRIPFVGHDTLLVADVDNRTGDPVFDVALKSAIESDLQQSRYANVFDRSRVGETLELMRRDRATRVTEEAGRDICRYAGLKALLLPRILSVGQVYDLYVLLIEPSTGRTIDRIRVTVKGREQVLLEAVDEVTRKVRALLGESLDSIATEDVRVAKASTSSWEALRDLSLAQRRWDDGKYRDAAALFERALEEDPHFMAARGSLGLLLIQFLEQPERGRELLRQALAESDSATTREKLLIRALNKQFVGGDPAGALDQYRLISDAYPDLMQPYNNSGMILRSIGRPEEAVAMFENAARAAPNSRIALSNLYWTYVSDLRRPAAAESVAMRMFAIDSLSATTLLSLGWTRLVQGRLTEAERAFRRALGIDPRQMIVRPNLAHLLLETGRTQEALPIYRQLERELRSAGVVAASASVQLALALRAAGAVEEADRVLDEAAHRVVVGREAGVSDTDRQIDLARVLAAKGEEQRALPILRQLGRAPRPDAAMLYYLSMIDALLGRREEAIGFLRRALDGKYWDAYYPVIGPEFAPLRRMPEFWALYPECRPGQPTRL
jgi:tetratricopeptide (TPR) repeat protein